MEKIKSFRELKVWQRAMDAAMRVFEISRSWPVEERFALTDQTRRSSRSVAADIAEAWRKRRYPAAFISRLNDAEAEAAETQTHVEVASRCAYVSPEDAAALDDEYEQVLSMLVAMATHPDRWTL